MQLVGRVRERLAIDEALDQVRADLSATVVLRGDAGMGKTTLLEYARSAASDFVHASVVGVEAESSLPFAAIQRLLMPFLDRVGDLPVPQRNALGVALGLAPGIRGDRYLVGLAVLTTLAGVASTQPLLCVVDDAQWLDSESLEVLGFVQRRLYADRIALMVAARDTASEYALLGGHDAVRIEGLLPEDADVLLASQTGGAMDPGVARKIVTATGGCPLAIIELARELSFEELAGVQTLPQALPLGDRLEAAFLRRVRALPLDTQELLLIASAEAHDDGLVRQAAALLGIPDIAGEPAVAAGLLNRAPRVTFAHPLIRSAIYAGASPRERRRIHQALADVSESTPAVSHAWHLAAAASASDETIAAQLERAAVVSRERGGYLTESVFFARAAELSPTSAYAAPRLLAAAEAALRSAVPLRALDLVHKAMRDLHDPSLVARAERVDGAARVPLWRSAEAPSLLIRAARTFESFDATQARATLLDAINAYLIAGQFTVEVTARELGEAALASLTQPRSGVSEMVLEAGAMMLARDFTEAAPAMRRALDALCTVELTPDEFTRCSILGTVLADQLLDDDAWITWVHRFDGAAREQGALVPLQTALMAAAVHAIRGGDLDQAANLHAELIDITRAIGAPVDFYSALNCELLAWRDDPGARSAATALRDGAMAAGSAVVVDAAAVALAVLELGHGNYADALAAARLVSHADGFTQRTPALALVVEAGVRGGDRDTAREAAAHLADRAQASRAPWALALAASSEALLDDGDTDELYRRSLEHLAPISLLTERARTQLLYGEWLRRQERKIDARTQLSLAYGSFADMGAKAYAERARRELAATGAHPRRRSGTTGRDLTPQEEQIAQLAGQGATNGEIAARLFISASTVDYHLRKVYRKFGIYSRRELGQALSP